MTSIILFFFGGSFFRKTNYRETCLESETFEQKIFWNFNKKFYFLAKILMFMLFYVMNLKIKYKKT